MYLSARREHAIPDRQFKRPRAELWTNALTPDLRAGLWRTANFHGHADDSERACPGITVIVECITRATHSDEFPPNKAPYEVFSWRDFVASSGGWLAELVVFVSRSTVRVGVCSIACAWSKTLPSSGPLVTRKEQ